MTRDELEKFLFETLAPSLEEAWRNGEAAEKDATDRAKENATLRKALEDERNRNKTHVRNKFGRSSCKIYQTSDSLLIDENDKDRKR